MNFKSFLTESTAQVWLWLNDEVDLETGKIFSSEKELVDAMLESLTDDMDDEALVKAKKELTTVKQVRGLDEADVFDGEFVVIYSIGDKPKPKVIRL